MNTTQAPQIIHDLVERFERNYEAYKSGSYNETQVHLKGKWRGQGDPYRRSFPASSF